MWSIEGAIRRCGEVASDIAKGDGLCRQVKVPQICLFVLLCGHYMDGENKESVRVLSHQSTVVEVLGRGGRCQWSG